MRLRAHISAMVLLTSMCARNACAQQAAEGQPRVLDSVVAIIDGDVLLASDIDEEVRFAAFLPYTVAVDSNVRVHAAERLIDRTLILHQNRLQPGPPISDTQVDRRIGELRKHIPACVQCTTAEGWQKYLSAHGFTEEEMQEEWRKRLEILDFIQMRFRQGIKISKPEIQAYYDTNLVPQFTKENVKPPPVDTIAPRIEEILLQQKVSQLLFEWLQTLREQGSVHILDPTIANISSPENLNKRAPEKPENKPQ
jgi:peptidyl-prolyl cis-trans isomerase SurA